MKIIISPPQQLCNSYNCSGLFFKDISNLKQYIQTINGTLFFTYDVKVIDYKLLKKMVYMFPSENALRLGANCLCAEPIKLYEYNISRDTKNKKEAIKTLYESLFIYFTIKKYGKPHK